MKAISTKYLPPTNTKPARLVASDQDGNRVVISYPHEKSSEAAHATAAKALCTKMHWTGRWHCGSLKEGYVFVMENSRRINP